jgi:SWI/SNF-related matrix-associated actin-dependent regulator of chromatin subfamily A3
MVGRNNKRRVAVVDLTHSDQENTLRPSKVARHGRMNPVLANVSNGQRFGEDTAYIPFSQRDDDETGVDDLVQSSQSVGDLDISAFQIYGIL